MSIFYVGCRGWSDPSWNARFYPGAIAPEKYLSHYSRSYNFVEVDRPYRNSPGWSQKAAILVNKQLAATPDNFRFSLRVPQTLLPLSNLDYEAALEALKSFTGDFQGHRKIMCLVIDVPRGLALADGRKWLQIVLQACSELGYSLAAHFHHSSWYQDLTYNMLTDHEAALVWSDNLPHPVMLSEFIYLRVGSAASWNSRWQRVVSDKYIEAKNIVLVANSPKDASLILGAISKHGRQGSGVSPQPTQQVWEGKSIACIDLNAFYPSCEEQRNPELKDKPHAVIMTDQPRGQITKGVVSSCSYEARKFGVKSAMPLVKALALCPSLILLPVDIPYYSTVSDMVMSVLEGFADVFEQASIDEAFLECTTKIDGQTPEQYANTIKKAVAEKCGLLCSVGIAPTKSAAKIASDFKKPDGLVVIYPDKIKEFLAPLEVGRVAGIGPKTEQALKEIGITTLGQLAGADVQKLVKRFGKNGQWMWSVANGTDSEQVVPRGDHVSVSTEYTLDEFTDDKDRVGSLLRELVPDIFQRAQKHGYTFRTVGVKLVRTDFTIETRETTFAESQDAQQSIASSIGVLLDRFRFDNELKVRKIGIRLTHLSSEPQATSKSVQKSLLDYT